MKNDFYPSEMLFAIVQVTTDCVQTADSIYVYKKQKCPHIPSLGKTTQQPGVLGFEWFLYIGKPNRYCEQTTATNDLKNNTDSGKLASSHRTVTFSSTEGIVPFTNVKNSDCQIGIFPRHNNNARGFLYDTFTVKRRV